MNSKLLIGGFTLAMSLLVGVSFAEDNASGPDWVESELDAACVASLNVCVASCASWTAAELRSGCESDCYSHLGECRAGIQAQARKHKRGQTVPQAAVL